MAKEYNPLDVANRLRDLADLRGVPMQQVLLDCGINRNAMTHMRTSMPSASSIAKLADRLDCSIDYLMGRSPQVQTPGVEQAIVESSRNAAEMLALYVKLSERDQVLLIGRLQNMVEQQGGGDEASPHTPTSSGSSPAKAV